jgi:hypothetical protein
LTAARLRAKVWPFAAGVSVDVDAATNPTFKGQAFGDLKTAARIITGSDRSLEPFAQLISKPSFDAEAFRDAEGDLLKAAEELLEATKRIESVVNSDEEVAKQVTRIARGAGVQIPERDLFTATFNLVTSTTSLGPAVASFVDATMLGRYPDAEKDITTLIKMRRNARSKGFFLISLSAQLIVALMSPDGGNLRWLGAAHDRKDFMHFEVKNGRDLLR